MTVLKVGRTVYHGTNLFAANLIKEYGIILDAQRPNTDFGRGFYVTHSMKQAIRWADVRAKRLQVSAKLLETVQMSKTDYLNHPDARLPALVAFDFGLNCLQKLKGKRFPFPDQSDWKEQKLAWEEFVFQCRKGYQHELDFVFGPIAGGHFKTNDQFMISTTKDQLSLNSSEAVKCLTKEKIMTTGIQDAAVSHIKKADLALFEEIKEAAMEVFQLSKDHANRLVTESWLSSIHPTVLLQESPYYWALSLKSGL